MRTGEVPHSLSAQRESIQQSSPQTFSLTQPAKCGAAQTKPPGTKSSIPKRHRADHEPRARASHGTKGLTPTSCPIPAPAPGWHGAELLQDVAGHCPAAHAHQRGTAASCDARARLSHRHGLHSSSGPSQLQPRDGSGQGWTAQPWEMGLSLQVTALGSPDAQIAEHWSDMERMPQSPSTGSFLPLTTHRWTRRETEAAFPISPGLVTEASTQHCEITHQSPKHSTITLVPFPSFPLFKRTIQLHPFHYLYPDLAPPGS